jgi:3-methyladenine DNA glycosylase/8-oxoguanine DNA glycosylase
VSAWSTEIPLLGAGGEPVDLKRTLLSHGFVELPPMQLDEDVPALELTLAVSGKARTIGIRPGKRGHARVDVAGRAPSARTAEELVARARHVLALDEDLSDFYELVAEDPELSWVAAVGAGRLIRSPSVFEDVVKTICTTNTAWSATRRMVTALVTNLGVAAPDGRHAFPTPQAMADVDEDFYREVVRSGYRGPYFRALATDVAEGRLDLEVLLDPELPDDEVSERLLALPGVGPYATAQILMLLGRYSRLILDSWSRPKYAQLNGRKAADKTIERRFRRYERYAGLAFWLYVTRDWVAEPTGIK